MRVLSLFLLTLLFGNKVPTQATKKPQAPFWDSLTTNAFNSITETVPESAEADCVGKYICCSDALFFSFSRRFSLFNTIAFLFICYYYTTTI